LKVKLKKQLLILIGGCYYGEDRVDLVNGGQRYIKELKVGDQIWSIKKKKSEIIKDEIVLMMHNDPNKSGLLFLLNCFNIVWI